MFEHGVRMRYRTDCGIAALATALATTWEHAYKALRFTKTEFYGVDEIRMARAMFRLKQAYPYASGASLISATGIAGVVLCRLDGPKANNFSEETRRMHWLAWEKDSEGRVWCFNPSDGEVFLAASMAGRGFYALCHFTVG